MSIDLTKNINDISFLISIIGIIIALIAVILYYKTKLTQTKFIDSYRQAFENKIYSLEKELVVTSERYEKLNHLIIDTQKTARSSFNKIEQPVLSRLFKDLDIDTRIQVNKKQIFVLIPFNEKFLETYKKIKDSCTSAGFDCKRGDEELVPNLVLKHILNQILSSRLIIPINSIDINKDTKSFDQSLTS